MDARNVYASESDSDGASYWNANREVNARTDRDVFRVFRDGAWNVNTYRKEIADWWWLRSIYTSERFLFVYGNGGLNNYYASGARLVRPSIMDARNVYASVNDVEYASNWNQNYEANALTDHDVFRVFRDGKTNKNTYRKEPGSDWWLRSICSGDYFLTVNNYGALNVAGASYARRVRPSVTIYYSSSVSISPSVDEASTND